MNQSPRKSHLANMREEEASGAIIRGPSASLIFAFHDKVEEGATVFPIHLVPNTYDGTEAECAKENFVGLIRDEEAYEKLMDWLLETSVHNRQTTEFEADVQTRHHRPAKQVH